MITTVISIYRMMCEIKLIPYHYTWFMDTLIFKFLDKSSFFQNILLLHTFTKTFLVFKKLKLLTKQHIYMVNAAKAVQLINLTKLLSAGR